MPERVAVYENHTLRDARNALGGPLTGSPATVASARSTTDETEEPFTPVAGMTTGLAHRSFDGGASSPSTAIGSADTPGSASSPAGAKSAGGGPMWTPAGTSMYGISGASGTI
ncbi:MAG: hypothetical protein DYG90_12910 [Chloroflexi bacterium CFX6]|nr:hypothetical protein [Chloroflexi bacterium CFX6]